MAQEDYVAIKSEALSQAAGEERYVIVNRWSREVVDSCNGHGYKSAMAAHKSWAYKQRNRSQRPGGQQQGSWRSSYRSAADQRRRPQDDSLAYSTLAEPWSIQEERRKKSINQQNNNSIKQ